jgi:hypothetical protein
MMMTIPYEIQILLALGSLAPAMALVGAIRRNTFFFETGLSIFLLMATYAVVVTQHVPVDLTLTPLLSVTKMLGGVLGLIGLAGLVFGSRARFTQFALRSAVLYVCLSGAVQFLIYAKPWLAMEG